MTAVLGISAFYHDSAAALVVDGEIIAAAQEERFTRRKHDHRFPEHAIRYCLDEAKLTADDIDYIGFYDKPLLKFDRLLETYLDFAPRGLSSFTRAMPLWLREKLWMPDAIQNGIASVMGKKVGRGRDRRILFGDHHESHAASAFYPSPFKSAAILTIDGVGEWATASIGRGDGATLELHRQLSFPDSLGLLYSAFTYFAGFRVNSGEYKLMGLAPYGDPVYVDLIRSELVEIADDGSLRLNLDYFGYCTSLRMTNRKFSRLFGGPPRQPETPITQRELDLARSIQEVTNEVVLRMARHARDLTGSRRLCMAGGVALNCVANGKIAESGLFDEIWVQPAAGDAGGALGVALAIWYRYLGMPRLSAEERRAWIPRSAASVTTTWADEMKGSFLGPSNDEAEIERFLSNHQIPHRQWAQPEIFEVIADLLAEGNVIGLHQGRMEFGPRALGSRSIIADPRSPEMHSRINQKVKFREGFRPFAPSVLREEAGNWFDFDGDSPYMLQVAGVAPHRMKKLSPEQERFAGLARLQIHRSDIPAVTHVDGSARVQTVRREVAPFYWEIINAFARKTGCPVIVNTSFNVRGEPIVCTPEDSFRCFLRTAIDILVLETFVIDKNSLAGWDSREFAKERPLEQHSSAHLLD